MGSASGVIDCHCQRARLVSFLFLISSVILAEAFRSGQHHGTTTTTRPNIGRCKRSWLRVASKNQNNINNNKGNPQKDIIIYYSPNFHRHVVAQRIRRKNSRDPLGTTATTSQDADETTYTVLQSFEWLDAAEQHYPSARRILSSTVKTMKSFVGLGLESLETYCASCNEEIQDEDLAQTSIFLLQQQQQGDDLDQKLSRVIQRLDATLGSSFLNYFPIHEQGWILQRIRFLLAPPMMLQRLLAPTKTTTITTTKTKKKRTTTTIPATLDVPYLLDNGYGAGLSEVQATSAIVALRHLLSMDPTNAMKLKPPLLFFFHELRVSFPALNEAKQELNDWLHGTCSEDAATFAHLKSLGLSWDQCRCLLHAFFHSLLSSDFDPSWELLESGNVPKTLPWESLLYLRSRLSLTPAELYAMIKTHSRLSTYRTEIIQSHMDTLQTTLKLSSSELRTLMLRYPTLLGTSDANVLAHVSFFENQLHCSKEQIKAAVQKLPALMQYSIESNLQPKVSYMTQTLGISPTDLNRLFIKYPFIFGCSLEAKIKVSVDGLVEYLGVSHHEIGSICMKEPNVLLLNWNNNLKPKLDFLKQRLKLSSSSSSSSLKSLIQTKPSLLRRAIVTYLEPKIQLLETLTAEFDTMVELVLANPNLLETDRRTLKDRILNANAFQETLAPDGSIQKKLVRKKRQVLVVSPDGQVVTALEDVKAAAAYAKTSVSNMYDIIRKGRTFKGQTYSVDDDEVRPDKDTQGDSQSSIDEQVLDSSSAQMLDVSRARLNNSSVESNLDDDLAAMDMTSMLRELLRIPYNGETAEKEDSSNPCPTFYLAVFVSGRTYPSDRSDRVRGGQKAGGLAIYLPQLVFGKSPLQTNVGWKILQSAATKCFGAMMMQDSQEAKHLEKGVLLLGYPYLRPSRNRCSLFVFRNALRLVAEILATDPAALEGSNIVVDVFTDSNYAWGLLHNTSSMLEWGSFRSQKEFVYKGQVPEWRANTDILYPLSRTYYRMVHQQWGGSLPHEHRMPRVKDITIQFRHQSEVAWTCNDPTVIVLGDYAKKAATWQYRTAQNALNFVQ